MDLTDPIRAVVPTLDGPVLRALAGTTAPMTGRQLHRVARTGSEAGVRRCLARLVDHGIVHATQAGQAWMYVGNRDHIAWPAVEALADLRHVLRDRIVDELAGWRIQPVVAGVFGSAARRDGGPDSDVDLLLVRPGTLDRDTSDADEWDQQVTLLGERIRAWSGNRSSPLVVSVEQAVDVIATEPLGENWIRDVDVLVGTAHWRDLVRAGVVRQREAAQAAG